MDMKPEPCVAFAMNDETIQKAGEAAAVQPTSDPQSRDNEASPAQPTNWREVGIIILGAAICGIGFWFANVKQNYALMVGCLVAGGVLIWVAMGKAKI